MKSFKQFTLNEKVKVECPKCDGAGCDHCDGKGYHAEPELNELSAEEKKLVNQMYDKKGNLTPLGKKVMNYNK
jgi:hypothetical protein